MDFWGALIMSVYAGLVILDIFFITPRQKKFEKALREREFDSGVLWGIAAYFNRDGDVESGKRICEVARQMREEFDARATADEKGQHLVNAAKKLLEKR